MLAEAHLLHLTSFHAREPMQIFQYQKNAYIETHPQLERYFSSPQFSQSISSNKKKTFKETSMSHILLALNLQFVSPFTSFSLKLVRFHKSKREVMCDALKKAKCQTLD